VFLPLRSILPDVPTSRAHVLQLRDRILRRSVLRRAHHASWSSSSSTITSATVTTTVAVSSSTSITPTSGGGVRPERLHSRERAMHRFSVRRARRSVHVACDRSRFGRFRLGELVQLRGALKAHPKLKFSTNCVRSHSLLTDDTVACASETPSDTDNHPTLPWESVHPRRTDRRFRCVFVKRVTD